MNRKKTIHKDYTVHETFLDDIITNYKFKGENFGNQDRNSLKLFKLNGKVLNVKSFRIPNLINQIVYKFLRKSKAQRSFEYATRLMKLGIGTPRPVAYYEYTTTVLFKKSYYISEQINCKLTYRELTLDLHYPNHETILRAFTRFTFELHEKGIHFLDHSPGNTLISEIDNNYRFHLVDLNRMEFKTLDFESRVKNFAKLTVHKSIIEVMSDEYAKCIGAPYERVFNLMWSETQKFQHKNQRKKKVKKILKFWKN